MVISYNNTHTHTNKNKQKLSKHYPLFDSTQKLSLGPEPVEESNWVHTGLDAGLLSVQLLLAQWPGEKVGFYTGAACCLCPDTWENTSGSSFSQLQVSKLR